MRIVAGKFRGLALTPVGEGDVAAHLRPTTDRVRESIFNLLNGGRFGEPIENARVLDLFAGTGALGLEALSRGAAHVTFVDDGAKANALIRKNINLCNAREQTRLLRADASRLGVNPDAPFDLVFADAPYGSALGELAIKAALKGGWLSDDAIIVFEEGSVVLPPVGFNQLDQRRYGNTQVMIFEPADGDQ
ncbi:MAG: 16S rRNA (guanine(966)-N(2))-methyltransferase RsmD [Marinosulfonomonas sp.]|nr:16S rRNA (guanine(966)-N(2))-methyltransferase RsmD [Marinosulfonomonas sp.]